MKIILKIVLPSIICLLIFYFYKINFYLFALPIGLLLAFANYTYFKKNRYLKSFLSIVISYVIFIIGYIVVLVLGSLLNNSFSDLGSILALILAAFCISPILLFYSLNLLYKFPKTSFSLLVRIISILLLVIYTTYLFWDGNLEYFKIGEKNYLLNPYIIWQPLMLFSVQLILYQRELKALFMRSSK